MSGEKFNINDLIQDEISDAIQDAPQQYTIPPGRVGWAYRELAQQQLQPQSYRNEDGSHTFHVKDPQTGAILAGILNYNMRDYTWGDKGTGKTPVTNGMFLVWLVMVALFIPWIFSLVDLGVDAFIAKYKLWPMIVHAIVIVFQAILILSHRNDELFLDSHDADIDGNPR